MSTTPAGWYDDGTGSNRLRYWDGSAWTHHFHPPLDQAAGQASSPAQQAQAQAQAVEQSTYAQASAPGQQPAGAESYQTAQPAGGQPGATQHAGAHQGYATVDQDPQAYVNQGYAAQGYGVVTSQGEPGAHSAKSGFPVWAWGVIAGAVVLIIGLVVVAIVLLGRGDSDSAELAVSDEVVSDPSQTEVVEASGDDAADVEAAYRTWLDASNALDCDGMAPYMTANFEEVIFGVIDCETSAEIGQEMIESGEFEVTSDVAIINVEVSGDTATFTVGTPDGSGGVEDFGAADVSAVRVDGEWKLDALSLGY